MSGLSDTPANFVRCQCFVGDMALRSFPNIMTLIRS